MRIAELVILTGMAAIGYGGGALWWVLPATAALTGVSWWRKVALLRRHPQVPFSTKMITYFVVGVILHAGIATGCYLAGRWLQWLIAE
jgi:hypothetical protein